MAAKLNVAICQFPVGANCVRNADAMLAQMERAKAEGARLAFFPEAALTGYAGTDLASFEGYDWDLLRSQTRRVMERCRELELYAVFGSAHELSGAHKPHNCLYAISPRGEVLTRYDKRFCTGGDLKHYSAGDHYAVFEADGVKIGLLICYDIRFPELYRDYKRLGVDAVLHAFYNARAVEPSTIHTVIMRPSLQASAASNHLWVAATNASGNYQSWPGLGIRPDGTIACKLRKNRPDVGIFKIDTSLRLYDASGPYRERAMGGVMQSGDTPRDARSRDLTGL